MRTIICTLIASAFFLGGTALAHPVMGDWEGQLLSEDQAGKTITAQIIGTDENEYRAVLRSDDVMEEPVEVELNGIGRGASAVFIGELDMGDDGLYSITAAARNGLLEGAARGPLNKGGEPKDIPFKLNKVSKGSPTLHQNPPAGAVALFNGQNLDHWKLKPGFPASNTLDIVSKNSYTSKPQFGSHRLHLEFRTPYMPDKRDQQRGNSGVYVHGRYEVQVLDSYGDEPRDNGCGGIYKVATPAVNACRPPGEWQTYDIEFHAPEFDEAGKKTKDAVMSVRHNGVLIHDKVALPAPTPGAISQEEAPKGPLFLQNHYDAVEYRNIWVAPLD